MLGRPEPYAHIAARLVFPLMLQFLSRKWNILFNPLFLIFSWGTKLLGFGWIREGKKQIP